MDLSINYVLFQSHCVSRVKGKVGRSLNSKYAVLTGYEVCGVKDLWESGILLVVK